MNIGRSSVFTLKVILKVHLRVCLSQVKTYFVFHILSEELSQHVRSDSAFASQNLKVAGQVSDDRR